MNNQDEIAYYREEDCCNSKKKDLVLFDPDLVSCSNHEYFDYYSSDEDDPDQWDPSQEEEGGDGTVNHIELDPDFPVQRDQNCFDVRTHFCLYLLAGSYIVLHTGIHYSGSSWSEGVGDSQKEACHREVGDGPLEEGTCTLES